jgi:short-subunit dehydrogenase
MPPQVQEVKGKCAVVTGTSQGLGVAIAKALAEEGVAKLIITARRLEKLTEVAGDISKANPSVQVLPFQGDVSSDEDNERLVAMALENFGEACPIILVNNAGVESLLHFDKAPMKKIDRMLDINLRGAIHLTRAFMPSIIKASGHVVNIGSVGSKIGGLGFQVYTSTKWGLLGFGQALRMDMKYSKYPVSVHTVMPGFVRDDGMAHNMAVATGVNLQDCLDVYGDSLPHHTGTAVVKSIKYDHPEWIVNSVPARAFAITREMFPRFMDFLIGLTDEGSVKCTNMLWATMNTQTFD